jgi:hypothetical protein
MPCLWYIFRLLAHTQFRTPRIECSSDIFSSVSKWRLFTERSNIYFTQFRWIFKELCRFPMENMLCRTLDSFACWINVFLTHGYSVGVFVSYCYQPQNQQFLLFSSSLLCAPETGRTGRTGLECFVIGCFHNACKHRAFGWISMSGLDNCGDDWHFAARYRLWFYAPTKDKNTTVRFSENNCSYGCQMY